MGTIGIIITNHDNADRCCCHPNMAPRAAFRPGDGGPCTSVAAVTVGEYPHLRCGRRQETMFPAKTASVVDRAQQKETECLL